MTARYAYDYHYALQTSAAGMGSRIHRARGRGNVGWDPGSLNDASRAIYQGRVRNGVRDC